MIGINSAEFCYTISEFNKAVSYLFELRHPRCVSNKSHYKMYVYIVRHSCVYVVLM
jgi:hypothetical protein